MEEKIYLIPDEEIFLDFYAKKEFNAIKNLTDEEYAVKYGNLIKKGAKFYKLIKNKNVQFKRPSRKQYIDFMMDYMECAVKRNGLKDVGFLIDSSFSGSAYTTESDCNHIWFSPKIFEVPKDVEEFYKHISTIEHELTHLRQHKEMPMTYKKLENENGVKPRLCMECSYEQLNKITHGKYRDEIDFMEDRYYFFSYWEVDARSKAIDNTTNFLKDVLQVTKDDEKYKSLNIQNNFSQLVKQVENTIIKEQSYNHYLSREVDYDRLMAIKRELYDYVSDVATGANYNGNTGEKYLPPDDIARIINLPEFENQVLYDKLFERVYNADVSKEMVDMVYILGNSVNNEKGLEMVAKYKDIIEKNLSKEGCDTIKKYFVKATKRDGGFSIIPDSLCDYFMEDGQEMLLKNKDKNNQINQQNNNEILNNKNI